MYRLKWILKNCRGYRFHIVIAYILAAAYPTMLLINPEIVKRLIDECVTGGDLTNLWTYGISMVAVTLIRTGVLYLMCVFLEQATQGMVHQLRTTLYRSMQRKDLSFFDNYRTGDLMTAMTSDIDAVRHVVAYVGRQILISLVEYSAAMIYFFLTNLTYTLAVIAVTPFVFLILRVYHKKARPLYKELRDHLSQLSTVVQENIAGNRVVKAFAREEFEIEKFDEKNKEYYEKNLHVNYMWLKFYPYIEALSSSMSVTSLVVGGILIINGKLSFGEFVAMNSLIWLTVDPLNTIGALLNDLSRFFASSDRLIQIENQDPTITNPENGYAPEGKAAGKIEFKDVSFGFGNTKVLQNVDFTVNPGETLAIMGETGCGKTTITNLITRFYDVKDGQVLVDGVDVRKWDLYKLRHNVGMATQDVFLFSDTVDGNIAYGDSSMSEEDVKKFAHISASDFIERMPEGYDTIIGERGVGLSGGQKQRIALARALAMRPAILILDDTTSAVDMETEKFIQHQLANLDFNCTKVIIAQRISSVQHADKIIILKDKKIAEMGSHQELLEQKGLYYEIYRIQQGLFQGEVID